MIQRGAWPRQFGPRDSQFAGAHRIIRASRDRTMTLSRFASYWILAACLIAVLGDEIFFHRYAGYYGRPAGPGHHVEGLLVLILGALIAWQSRRTPRFVFAVAVFTTLLCGLSLAFGFHMSSTAYLSRNEPRFPLEEFPTSFARIIPFVMLFWTLPVVLAVAHGPKLVRCLIGKWRRRAD